MLQEVQELPAVVCRSWQKHSEHPVSPKKVVIGHFGRGMMVKAFEDTVFKEGGDISGLVEFEFGYHIMKLTGFKPGTQRGLHVRLNRGRV